MSSPHLPMIPPRLSLDALASVTGVHPDLLRRFVELGIITPISDMRGRQWFTPDAVGTVQRAVRLRTGLGLSYSAVVIVGELLDRIDLLENRRSVPPRHSDLWRKDTSWI
ncbi:chaperone modulator CbpM [Leifsonia sp. TF02-11]|uniref:chaperone modulator CbpM n=1 Tax=Leifsonia sp. TF02-11 TaxID=2815212 RepID=UPI001AA10C7E|nr:chaperone modulator CbpM [Leifsonia sp. TF02-11]MBO1740953.1 MerR family transcriptional regulator [Leifsonia sp. TF02-11]